MRVLGACVSSSDVDHDAIEGVPVLGTTADVGALTHRMPVDVVAVHDVDQLGGVQLAKLHWGLEETGTQISIITPLTNTAVERLHVRRLGRRLIVDVSHGRPTGVVAGMKLQVERLAALAMLIVAAPMIVTAAVAVVLESRGPAVFRQTRVREYGATFTMYKLRTMHQDAEARLAELAGYNEVGGGLFKMKDDPRITRVGRWLRKLSIDELPQLWNVVRGDMSLIGPRPALPSEVATYDEVARRRLTVKPGLTGLWQVSGRSGLTWDESVRIDTDYVDNWRASRDVMIALRTVRAVLKRDGAH
jgi:lipopolysaccharide/colanic/teichoic acid biosynthesis glycosyltransferase